MKKFISLLSFVLGLGLASAQRPALATDFRFLLIENYGGDAIMTYVPQVTIGGGPWETLDPFQNPELYEKYPGLAPENFDSNFRVSDQGPHSITLNFDFFNMNNPSLGARKIDVGNYNYFAPGTDFLTAYLRISQTDALVTINYVSFLPGMMGIPLPSGTPIEGVPSLNDVAFANGVPLCETATCQEGAIDVVPNDIFVQIARIPEPPTLLLLLVATATMIWIRSRSNHFRFQRLDSMAVCAWARP